MSTPLTFDMVAAIMPQAPSNGLAQEWPHLIATLNRYEITTKPRVAAFLANVAKESGELYYVREIHDGSDYEWRADLGNIYAGDGVRFRGRGYIQMTGRNNNLHVLAALGLGEDPERLEEPEFAWRSAGYYWRHMSSWGNLNLYADEYDFASTVVGVRGGGDPDRWHYWYTALEVLPDDLVISGGEASEMAELDPKLVDDFIWYCQQLKGRPYTYERGRDGTSYDEILASGAGPDCSGMPTCVLKKMGLLPESENLGTVAISNLLVDWEVYDPNKFYPRGWCIINDNATGWVTGDDSHVGFIVEDGPMIAGYPGQRFLHSWNPKGVDDTGTDIQSHEYARYEWAGKLPYLLKTDKPSQPITEATTPAKYEGITASGYPRFNSDDCTNGWYELDGQGMRFAYVGRRWTKERGYF